MSPDRFFTASANTTSSFAAAFSAAVLFGGAVTATRFLSPNISPMTLAFLRFGSATAVLLPLLVATVGFHIRREDLGSFVVLGVSLFGLFPLTFNMGLRYTLASRGALMLATMPILTAIVSGITRQEKIGYGKITGTILGFLGIGFVVGQGLFTENPNMLAGDFLMLLTSLVGAICFVFAKPLFKRYSPLQVTCLPMAFGAFFLAPLSYLESAFTTFTVGMTELFVVAYLAVPAGAVGYFLWIYALRNLTPIQTVVFVNFNPLSATILSVWLLREDLTILLLLGLILVLVSVSLTNYPQK